MFLKQGINLGGREFTMETGRIAKQADGAVLVSQRRSLLDYLKGRDINRYHDLINRLGLRK